tara:strand:+ start:812 stop:943 length:132 start_codon:yes stop_codon:yes gene_type:complete
MVIEDVDIISKDSEPIEGKASMAGGTRDTMLCHQDPMVVVALG